MLVDLVACAALAVWIYLIAARGGFWMAAVRDDGGPAPATWPSVTVVIPARDEAAGVGETIASLVRQDYRGAPSSWLTTRAPTAPPKPPSTPPPKRRPRSGLRSLPAQRCRPDGPASCGR